LQVTTHWPFVQVAVALAGAVQAWPQAPQLLRLLRRLVSQPSAYWLLQSAKPLLQAATVQTPLLHLAVPLATLQTLPQAPQLFGSRASGVHVPLQFVNPELQVQPQAPLLQAAVALGGAGHALPQAPQLLIVLRSVSQPSLASPLQSAKPALQV
jgi:hypothetical protein